MYLYCVCTGMYLCVFSSAILQLHYSPYRTCFPMYSCTIQNSILCANVIVELNCNLNNCYVGSHVKIPTLSKLKSETLSSKEQGLSSSDEDSEMEVLDDSEED